MLNPYDFAFRKIKKIVSYNATEDEKMELILKTVGILSTKVSEKNWFYTHPAFNDRFYSNFGTEKTTNKVNFNNPWVTFFINVMYSTSLLEVKEEIYRLEKYSGYRDWIVENVRKKRVLS